MADVFLLACSRRYGVGPLAAVGRIDPGDVVWVTTGRKTLRFEVEEVLRVPKRTLDLDRLFAREGRPLLHRHSTCGHVFDPVTTCSVCHEPVSAREVTTLPGPAAPLPPDAGTEGRRPAARRRKAVVT